MSFIFFDYAIWMIFYLKHSFVINEFLPYRQRVASLSLVTVQVLKFFIYGFTSCIPMYEVIDFLIVGLWLLYFANTLSNLLGKLVYKPY